MRKSKDNVNHSLASMDENPLELIHKVMHLYRAQQFQVLRHGPHDVTHMESKVMGHLGQHPGATQSDLARESGRDKAQLARLIKGLRDRGLLEGTADEADRRNVRLTLTASGQAVLQVLQQQSAHLATQAVAGLKAAEQQQLIALLRQVQQNLTRSTATATATAAAGASEPGVG